MALPKADLTTLMIPLRYAVAIGAGALIAKNLLSQSCVNEITGLLDNAGFTVPVGGAVGLGVMALGWISHKQQDAAIVTAAATGVPTRPGIIAPIIPKV